jgi:hypothetical protein
MGATSRARIRWARQRLQLHVQTCAARVQLIRLLHLRISQLTWTNTSDPLDDLRAALARPAMQPHVYVFTPAQVRQARDVCARAGLQDAAREFERVLQEAGGSVHVGESSVTYTGAGGTIDCSKTGGVGFNL